MRYEAPESLEGAVALLAEAKGEARVLEVLLKEWKP